MKGSKPASDSRTCLGLRTTISMGKGLGSNILDIFILQSRSVRRVSHTTNMSTSLSEVGLPLAYEPNNITFSTPGSSPILLATCRSVVPVTGGKPVGATGESFFWVSPCPGIYIPLDFKLVLISVVNDNALQDDLKRPGQRSCNATRTIAGPFFRQTMARAAFVRKPVAQVTSGSRRASGQIKFRLQAGQDPDHPVLKRIQRFEIE